MINIALCFHDSGGLYYQKATTTMVSVLENTNSLVCFHIVHDETLKHDNQNEMLEVVEKYKQRINFYSAPEIDNEIVESIDVSWGRGTLYRLFLYKLINLDNIIYLDCDIICELDIHELSIHDLGALPLAAVHDYGQEARNSTYLKSIGVDPAKYFNAGVLLLNLKWFREHGDEVLQIMTQQLSGKAGKLWYADQDVLNIFFTQKEGYILYLDEKFNYTIDYNGRSMQEFCDYNNKILHMIGSQKPWEYFNNASLLYWKYYSKTPWGKDVIENILETHFDSNLALYRFIQKGNRKELKWVRRIHDYHTLGFWGYLKKRLYGTHFNKICISK